MNKKLLCAALLCGLGVAQAASAQQFDDRWYVSGATGVNFQDKNRDTQDAIFGMLGFGKFWTPNWSTDLELNYQNPDLKMNPNLWWTQYGATVAARYHFRHADSKWWPYLKAGIGMQRHEQQFAGACGSGMVPGTSVAVQSKCPAVHKDNNVAAELGAGLQFDFGRVNLRTEIGARADFDKVQAPHKAGAAIVTADSKYQALAQPQHSQFTDMFASVGLTVALGPDKVAPVVAPPPPPPAQPTCADKDSDGDGVNDCDDKCPDTKAGEIVGADGCPKPVAIDLKGVHFNFDYPKRNWNGKLATAGLVAGSTEIMDNAVQVLQANPSMRVEVAGHTDLCGTDAYNQSLSERRARVVYDYLTTHGIDAGRLAGPVGYGESRPLVQTPQTKPECKNEENRRTELNSQQ